MSTGDIKNNLRKLQRLLRQVGFKEDVDYDGMAKGLPVAILPIYHYVMTSYSRHLVAKLSEMDVHMMGTTDTRFIELMYKVLRDVFQYRPGVPKEKFFSAGFAERKIIMCTEVVLAVQKLHLQHEPLKPTSLNKAQRPATSKLEPKKTNPLSQSVLTTITEKPTQKRLSLPYNFEVKNPTTRKAAPATTQTGQKCMPAAAKSVYKAAAYAADDPVAEVVRMNEPSNQLDAEPLRPIDIIAQTPIRSVACASHLSIHESSLLDGIVQRLDELSERVTGMDERLVTMETIIGAQFTQQGASSAVNAGQIETMLARLTLMETRMRSVDAKISSGANAGLVVAGPTAEQWEAIGDGTPNPITNTEGGIAVVAGTGIDTPEQTGIHVTPVDNGHINGVMDSQPPLMNSSQSNYRDYNGNSAQDEVPERFPNDGLRDDPKSMPSPIVCELIRQVVRESCSEASDDIPQEEAPSESPRVSTPKEVREVNGSFSEAFNNLSGDRLQQAQRIESMMKDTEETLKT